MTSKNIESIYPLSSMQMGILFECLSAPESGAYIQQLVCTLRGSLEVAAFQAAWQHAVQRHAVLRTLFVANRGEKPLQVVRRTVALPFEFQDWSGISRTEQDRRLQSLLKADRGRGFTLSDAPLFRIFLLRTSHDAHRLLLSFHHLILDGWSLPLLFKEVFDAYGGRIGVERAEPARSRPYRDYIQWLLKQDISGAQTYWRQALRDFHSPTRIAANFTGHPDGNDGIYFEQKIQFSAGETAQLQSAVKQEGLTLSLLMQGAWAMLLSRYSGEEDVVFGLTVSGRSANLAGIEAMVGLFINTLPVRLQAAPEKPLRSWFKELQARQAELTQYEHIPLSQVQKWSEIPAGSQLFESILVFENYPLETSLLRGNQGLTIEDVEAVEITNYPLTVAAVPHPDLRILISYDRRRFDDAAVTRMLGHLRTILLSMASARGRLIREVAWVTPAERRQLLVEWNQTAAEYPPEESVHAMFEKQARENPERIAVTSGARRLTYAELNERANQLANYLRRQGVKEETFVGLCAERSLEIVVGILGILKAGGVYAPVDVSWPAQRKAFVLKETHAQVVLADKGSLAGLSCFEGRVVSLDAGWEEIGREQAYGPAAQAHPESLAYVIHTSGTTGNPKGVMISHRALCNHLRWMQAVFPLGPEDRVPQKYSLSFDVSVLEIFYPLMAGARLVVAPPSDYFDSTGFVDFLAENKITAIDLVPSMLRALVQEQRFLALADLRQVTCGGDILPHDLRDQFFARSAAELANLYGPTEITIGATFQRCRPGDHEVPVPIGRPISNTEVYIFDEHMEPVPAGIAGEIYIGGAGLARGYLRDPELTAQKFVPHRYSRISGERLYRTGDRGRYRADGNIEYIGRADHQVKIRGYRIEPGEIEVVLRSHAAVQDAVVLVHGQQLVAYVAGASTDWNGLRQYLRERLPEYMLPAHFIGLDKIPTLASGKLDRKALPAPQSRHAPLEGNVPPRNPTEAALAAIWSFVLKVEHLGVENNFFESGGDSIISLQIVARARQQGIRITPRQMFEHPTIAALAAVAERVEDSQDQPGKPEMVEGEVALTPIQRWFFEQGMEQAHQYNQAVLVRASEELRSEWLEAGWKKLVEHHDALRLRYRREAGEWRQSYASQEANRFFSVVELQGNGDDQSGEMERAIAGLQQSLDLEQGPLLRVAHVKPDRMVVVIHHLAVDGVSWRILLEDLETVYRQLSRGEEVQLPAKTTSYQRWAGALARAAEAGRYERELEYWLREEGQAEEEKMPRDWEGGENREASRGQVEVELEEEPTRQLLQEAPGAYHTQINDVLLLAIVGAWEKWTGQGRLWIDVEGHGREAVEEEMDVTRTVGWFTAVYPVRLEVGKGEGTGERLKGIKEQLRRVPGGGVGYGVLRYLGRDRRAQARLERARGAEISFNYLGQVETGVREGGLFRGIEALEANSQGEKNRRSHLVEVECRVQGGRLRVQWNYSREAHRRATIEALARGFVEELGEIIRHCLAPGAGGFTPSDFPLAQLDQHTLDVLAHGPLVLVKDHRSIEDIYPLSPIQQGLLFHTLYAGPRSGTYVEQLSCTLEGNVNIRAFEDAWQQVVDCHPLLRTSFIWEGLQGPLQIVHRSADACFTHHDWSQMAGDPQQHLEDFGQTEIEQGFDLSRPPLMRLTFVQMEPGRFEFIWSSHHLLLDGWSASLVLHELLERYDALCAGALFEAARSRPYRDYIAWLLQQDLTRAKEYWESLLRDFHAAVPCPGERLLQSATTDRKYRGQQLTLSADATADLQATVGRQQVTLNVLVQAAWALLLRHYTGHCDLVFGVTVSGRPAELAGVDRMVGVFINTLPQRLSLSSDKNVLAALKELKGRQLRIDEYAYTPLTRIQEWSGIPAGAPLFETIVVFENYPVNASLKKAQGRLKFSNVRSRGSTSYPLTLIAKPGDELALELAFDAGRFEPGMIAQMLRHLQNLLEGLTAGPDRRVHELQLLSRAEREQLLVAWNQTEAGYPQRCLHELFEEQAARTPEAMAVEFEGQQLNYGELNRRSNQLGHYLRKLGVGAETRVAICMERSLELVVSLLAVLKAGGAYVPLDPGSPSGRTRQMLDDAAPVVVLSTRVLSFDAGPRSRTVVLEEPQTRLALEQASGDNLAREDRGTPPFDQNPAYVLYTSGTTGQPKGVVITHQAICNHMLWLLREFGFSHQDRVLQKTLFTFDASVWEFYAPLLSGGQLVLAAPDAHRDPRRLLHEIRQHGITILQVVPTMLATLLLEEDIAACSNLRLVFCGGEILSRTLQKRFTEQCEAEVVNLYGPTEATIDAACWRSPREPWKEDIPIGKPIANLRTYVLNEGLEPQPIGVAGELCIGGAGLARGYLNRPELTGERFIPDPFSRVGGERLYRTGDQARWRTDGNLEFLGRLDHQVKIRGHRIELGEIEWALTQHEAIYEAVAAVKETENGEKALVAYVVMKPSQKFEAPDLQKHLKNKLPDYMRPGIIVPLENLPLTPNGKVDYKALPGPGISRISEGIVPPRTAVEHAVAEIWREIFGIQKLSVDDNFFHLGGHSLLAMRITSLVKTILGVDLPLRSIFEEPTVAGQAREVEKLIGSGKRALSGGILPLPRPGNLPLSFAQQRLWFLHQLEPASDFYNVPIALRIRGPLNVNTLSDCCNEIVRRHEVLRTVFPVGQGVPVQQIREAGPVRLAVVGLDELPFEQADARAAELMARDAKQPFDLSCGPLLRAFVLRLAPDSHVLFLNMHHIIVDEWSLGIFIRELALLYEAFLAGRSSPLPPIPIQYADYALWQRDWFNTGHMEDDLVYWRRQLSGAAAPELPTDHPRPKVQTFQGARKSISPAPRFVKPFKELARRENSTLFMALLAVLKVLLYRYTGQAGITVGTPVAGRMQRETEALMGFFVNTLALRTQVSGRQRFAEFLHRVREVTLGAYAHQDLPFDKLVEDLHPDRHPGHTPFFQVMFTLEDSSLRELSIPGLQVSPIEIEGHIAKFDLTVAARETAEGLSISFEYNSDLFEDATIERMMGHFERLLCGIVANPKQHISGIPLLSEEESRQVLVEWNNTAKEYPRACIQHLFEEQARRSPQTVAVVFQDRKLTYEGLNRRANQLARYLIRNGVGPEARVGLCMERSLETIVSLLGILKAGGVYVALDGGSPRERLELMLAECGAHVVLSQRHLRERLPERPSLHVLCVDEEWERIAAESCKDPKVEIGADYLAYVSYTSGSTGRPKGVSIPHRGVARLVKDNDYARLGSDEVMLQFAPLAFDASTLEVWGSLLNGGRLVVMGPGPRSAEEIGKTLMEYGVTTAWMTAGLFNVMVDEQLEKLTHVRQVLAGGEALSEKHVNRYLAAMREDGVLINGYGPTENTTFTCCQSMRKGEVMGAMVPIGRPIGNTQAYVLDQEMQPVAVGVEGELYIAGEGLARGYENDAAQTAEKFVPHQYGPAGERLYRSGDLARWRPDGTIEYVGRRDRQIKLRGYRVELGEIEAVTKQHPDVSQAVVALREDPSGEVRLIAYVVINDSEFDAEKIRNHIKARLPEYMAPVFIVPINEIPLTLNGKIDHGRLPEISFSGLSATHLYVAPRNAIEEQVAKACCDLLGIQRMGIHDNFFDAGGHSLLAMRLMTWTRETFQAEAVPLRMFFETPTIAGLAALIVAHEPLAGQTEKIAKFLQRLDAMSPQEMMELRAKQTVN